MFAGPVILACLQKEPNKFSCHVSDIPSGLQQEADERALGRQSESRLHFFVLA
jgi:hypothetical protein